MKVANDRKGFAAIVRWLGTKGVERIVYELRGRLATDLQYVIL